MTLLGLAEQGAPVLREQRGEAVLESGKSCGLETGMQLPWARPPASTQCGGSPPNLTD